MTDIKIAYTKKLAALLRDAQKAHHVYEGALGHPDKNWPDWYAAYIVERLDTPIEKVRRKK